MYFLCVFLSRYNVAHEEVNMPDSGTIVIGVSFAAYTLFIVLVGLWSSRWAKRSDEDYFLAGRSLGKWIAALSASASSESGWVTLGLVGWAYGSGVSAYWIIPGCLFGYFFNWFFLAGRMRDRAAELNALTIPDLFSFHFRERVPLLRVLSVIVILVAMVLYVAAQFNAAGKSLAYSFTGDVSGSNYRWGVLAGAAIVLVYTVTGGFRAVCWTDFLQALLMLTALVIFPVYLLFTHGGFAYVHGELAQTDPATLHWIPQGAKASGPALFGFLLGSGALGINFGYPGQPHVLVRFMALKDRKEAAWGGVISMIWGLFVYWGAVTVGLFARAMQTDGASWTSVLSQDKELGLVAAAQNLLPGVLGGLVLAAVLAAICSTADSQLLVAASAAANDLYKQIFRKGATDDDPQRASGMDDRGSMWINRGIVFTLGIIAVLLVIDQKVTVYDYVLTYGWAILGASFGPQVILLLIWRRASYAGCLAGMLTGFVMAIVWKLTYMSGEHTVEIYNLPLAFVAAMVVNVLISLLTSTGKKRVTA